MSDLEHCASPSRGVQCSDSYYEYIWVYKGCDQVPGAIHQNYGCHYIASENSDYFECTNRMDKSGILFNTPPGARILNPEAINYNRELIHFDKYQVFCGSKNISYTAMLDALYSGDDERCLLKSGKSVYVSSLFEDLLLDYSFQFSSTIGELL